MLCEGPADYYLLSFFVKLTKVSTSQITRLVFCDRFNECLAALFKRERRQDYGLWYFNDNKMMSRPRTASHQRQSRCFAACSRLPFFPFLRLRTMVNARAARGSCITKSSNVDAHTLAHSQHLTTKTQPCRNFCTPCHKNFSDELFTKVFGRRTTKIFVPRVTKIFLMNYRKKFLGDAPQKILHPVSQKIL